uniref:uncharacterized protein LOC120339850 n=1 Tax=Styela clava TaxID=7725 RepID=UPI0019394848|nr:uncharacterized protein LOC120339850 [Styela clava]
MSMYCWKNNRNMVSPCLGRRISSRTKDVSKTHHLIESEVNKAAPPTGFQFFKENVKLRVQPKQKFQRKNAVLDSRRLGNIRASLLHSGAEEVVFIRKKFKSTYSDSTTNLTWKPHSTKTPEFNSRTNKIDTDNKYPQSENIHYTGKSEVNKRRVMTAALSSMLGVPNDSSRNTLINFKQKLTPGGHKIPEDPINSLSNLHRQRVPDARSSDYRVHKWRRKSNSRKYAGMESLSTASKINQAERKPRKMTLDNSHGFGVSTNNDRFKRPMIPLPAVNLLPALRIQERSNNGAYDGREITFAFSRNAAMENLERRFHDNSWKNNRSRKSEAKYDTLNGIADQDSHKLLLRETRRTKALRRAASFQIAHNESGHKSSAIQTSENLESPDKIISRSHNVSRQDGFGQLANGKFVTDSHRDINVADNNLQVLLSNTDAVKYKIIADSSSEEIVTIVSKASEDFSHGKNSVPADSKTAIVFPQSSSIVAGTDNVTEYSKIKGINRFLAHSPNHQDYRPSKRRFPILPEFLRFEKSKFENGAAVFNQLKKSIKKENEEKYFMFSRKNNGKQQTTQKMKKRVVLPPLRSQHGVINEYSNQNTWNRSRLLNEGSEVSDVISPLGSSPNRKKPSRSYKTSPLSRTSAAGGLQLKDQSSTPADSTSSRSTGGRRKSNKWRRRSIRSDSKGSPQFYRAQKQTKLAKLMDKWRAAIRLTIMFDRLCNDHYIVTDDSYNIHFGRTAKNIAGPETKQEVLFDVMDYKTKNQQRLSDTTRKTLSIPSENRTDQDVRMVQTALRNVKAISDHSSSVQENIARSGYFVGFESKRVVVLENRCPLNFYVLLAGSAVVIKQDENGNTNPVSFLKRGDIFGEHEILDNSNWGWSVVTVDSCEFLLLDKQEYVRIFLAGGSGGILNDPDRGSFLRNLTLFRGWPTQKLDANPNRCLFRYYKRGTLLAKDSAESDWIFVVKSGSCSVLKPLKVQNLTLHQIFRKQMAEQTAILPSHLMTHLVEKQEEVNEEDHLNKIQNIEDNVKADQVSVATSYKQIEMASLLKELNIDIKEGFLTPVSEEDDEEGESGKINIHERDVLNNKKENTVTMNITGGDIDAYVAPAQTDTEFRMSRVSDRAGTPRTPSPMKAAYLQTGISSPQEDGSRRNHNKHSAGTGLEATLHQMPEKSEKEANKPAYVVDTLSADDFLSKLDSSSDSEEDVPAADDRKLKKVYVNIRKLTRGNSFGLGSVLFNEQPSLALISNGAECLVLNKKFYLDNMSDESLKNLRDTEHPYPSESDLHESYWRLISWKAFQRGTVQRLHLHRAKVRHYSNPTKTGVY